MRAFGARGFVSEASLQRTRAFLAQCRAKRREKDRAIIVALSDLDIAKIMARVIVEATVARGAVCLDDFKQAGIPEHRIAKNRDAAFRLARKREPKLDAIGAQS